MGTEENYLDNLLKSIADPKPDATQDVAAEEPDQISEMNEEEVVKDGQMDEEIMKLMSEPDVAEDTVMDREDTDAAEPASVEKTAGFDSTDGLEELELTDIPDTLEVPDELEIADVSEELDTLDIPDTLETSDMLEMADTPGELEIADIPEELDIPEISEMPEEPEIADILEVPPIPDGELTEENNDTLDIGDIDDLDMPALSEDGTEVQLADEPGIDGLETEKASLSETELEMAEELNLEELDLDATDLDTTELDTPNTDDDLGILDSIDIDDEMKEMGISGVDDGLDDVLSMLDDDADLAEINDILKKSDSNEPIQDEMMDLLNQMADDEAALVNAGVKDIEEDGDVPIPDMLSESKNADDEKQASSKKKKKNEDGEKKPGAIGKLFNLLTEELPGPTEADYAAEDAKKEAKKQEALTKKEEEKLAKEEAKQAKAEEKEAAKKAKAEAAAQKKKEKDEAKAKKAAEKQAKQAAEAGKRAKRIPPKKIAAVAVFGASVFGGVIVATTVLSNQGYINVAKKAFYDGNYKEAYLATYGMELQDSDVLVAKKSEVILKMQRWYDSYQNNLKLGREREALDALVRSFESYDYINAEAEEYGVLNEIDSIKQTILGVLQSEYGLNEEQARALLNYEDALEYTVALNNIITGK